MANRKTGVVTVRQGVGANGKPELQVHVGTTSIPGATIKHAHRHKGGPGAGGQARGLDSLLVARETREELRARLTNLLGKPVTELDVQRWVRQLESPSGLI